MVMWEITRDFFRNALCEALCPFGFSSTGHLARVRLVCTGMLTKPATTVALRFLHC